LIRCPDIRRAELELEAAKLDVLAARAEFFPSLRLTAGIGYEAFNAPLLFSTPQSMLYSAAGELLMLVFNRKASKPVTSAVMPGKHKQLLNMNRLF